MSITQEQLDHYDETLQRHLRGEATSEEVSAADPLDAALRRMAERAHERHKRERKAHREHR